MTSTISLFKSDAIGSHSFQSSIINSKPQAVSYHARLNVIRFVAICSVVWGHCLLGLEKEVYGNAGYQIAQAVLIQAGRVGTIMFFIVSGFLLFDKIERFTPLTYLRYRFHSVMLPWIIFLLLLVFIQLSFIITLNEFAMSNLPHILKLVLVLIKGSVFHAAYWFVPVAVFSSMMLIAFKQYIGKVWFGLVLAGLSLFYCINLYRGWLPVSHTTAIFGYMFYLWLGAFVKMHISAVRRVLDRFSAPVMFFLFFTTFLVACAEGVNLTQLGCADAYASLRFSNAELSVILFAILLKSHRLGFIDRLQPQKTTYGIYLVHSLIIMLLVPYANRFVALHNVYPNLMQLAVVQVVFFISVFALTFIIVSLVRRSPFRVILGLKS